jgi:hypothetical protein
MADEHVIAVLGSVSQARGVSGQGTDAPAVTAEGADDVASEVAGRTADHDGPTIWRS